MSKSSDKLTIDANACLDQSLPSCNSKNLQQNLKIINELDLIDLNFIEKDLDFYEKVSIIFLICGYDKNYAKIATQQLTIGSFNEQSTATTYLYDWLNKMPNWKDTLLEALCIIQAKRILHKLGLNYNELYINYLPDINETQLFIHPILKSLYKICEQFLPEQTKNFILYIQKMYPIANELKFTNYNYLEIYLLHWISESLIDIGEWQPGIMKKNVRVEFCNVEPITQFLKQNEFNSLYDQLKNISIRLNFTTNNIINKDKNNKETLMEGKNKLSNEKDNNNNICDDMKRRNFFNDGQSIDENLTNIDRYLIRKDSIGYALIINQMEFSKNNKLPEQLSTRHGSDKDKIALNKTFSSFGYTIIEEENLTDYDIIVKIKDIVNRSVNKDSLIVCILSHGHEGIIYGSNSEPLKVKVIEKLIASHSLLNKPKILIIQACQGDIIQKAVKNEQLPEQQQNKLEYDGPTPTTSSLKFIDLIVAKSTIAGFASIRHIDNGTWFIQTLCKKINELSNSEHFVDILTMVCNDISLKRGADNQCMSPWFEMNLTKKLYFPQKD